MSGQGKVVCVTGASGYIASWLVKLLLQRGYTVHATVRSMGLEKQNAAKRLWAVANLINQAVGDALSGLLLVEAILQHKSWSVNKWNHLYHDLPSRQLKVKVADRTAVVTTIAETSVEKPPGLQEAITSLTDDPKKTEHLRALDGANERLSFFEANLIEEGSFESAVNGCECVFHTASPVILSVSNPQAQLLEPAVKGTLNVLKSAAKVPSLKRVVLTSSIATLMFPAKPQEFGDVMDETWYSDPETCEQEKLWYVLSKILAEDAAVKFCKENGLELVVINPGYVIGPMLQPTLNLTSEGIMGMIESGKEIFPSGIYRLVDVRDVATAHILAFENPEANGRYCVVGVVARYSEIMKIINKHYPARDHAKSYKDGNDDELVPNNVSRARAENLGIEFTPLEVTIKDTLESLKEKNFLSF